MIDIPQQSRLDLTAMLRSIVESRRFNFAITAVATDEQFERFGNKFAAMAITEPGSGSDSGSISTTALLDGDEWIINGEKIFVTDGKQCEAVVVWATVDRSAGKAGIKSFVVEKDRPGVTVTKLEHKRGIRASDTAELALSGLRVPAEATDPVVQVIQCEEHDVWPFVVLIHTGFRLTIRSGGQCGQYPQK